MLAFRGVDTTILNEKKQAPIHLATELNKVRVLEVMGKHKGRIDIQLGGEHGRTALHLAAIYDHEECARTLVSIPATMCKHVKICLKLEIRVVTLFLPTIEIIGTL